MFSYQLIYVCSFNGDAELNIKYMYDENGWDMFICEVHVYIFLYESSSHTHVLVYASFIRTYTMSFDLYSKIKNIKGMSFLNINNPMYWSSFYVLESMYTFSFTLSKNQKIFCVLFEKKDTVRKSHTYTIVYTCIIYI